jgi:hypothetical protein
MILTIQTKKTAGVSNITTDFFIDVQSTGGSREHLRNRQGSIIIVTVKEQVLVLPPISVAVQVTVVVPGGKKEPEAGVQTTDTPGLLSFTVGGG